MMRKRKPHVTYEPHAAQRDVLASRARIVAAISGFGGGKTSLGARWLIGEIEASPPGSDHIVTAPTYGHLNRNAIPALIAYLEHLGFHWQWNRRERYGYTAQDHIYRLPASLGGGRILFISAERPGSLQGVHAFSGWLDESIDIGIDVLETLESRLALNKGRLLITSTPYDRGWLYERVFKAWAAAGRPVAQKARDTYVRQWKSIDNPAFDPKEFERLRATLPEWLFSLHYEGSFDHGNAGLVYDVLEFTPARPIMADSRIMGLDWGSTHPLGAIWIAQEGSRLIAYDEYRQSAMKSAADGTTLLPAEMLEEIAARCQSRHEVMNQVFCDPARPDLIELTRRLFLEAGIVADPEDVQAADHDWRRGFEAAYGLMKTGRFEAFDTLTYLKDEHARYTWRTDAAGIPQIGVKPKRDGDDLLDTLRYALVQAPTDFEEDGLAFSKISAYPDPFVERVWMYRNTPPKPVSAGRVKVMTLSPEQRAEIEETLEQARRDLDWHVRIGGDGVLNSKTGLALRRHVMVLEKRLSDG